MYKINYLQADSTEIKKEGFKGMRAYYPLCRQQGCPNYALRVMEFQPGGHTAYHAHKEEHELFFLEGEGLLITTDGQTPLKPGDAVLTAPCEMHQFKNTGTTVMRMVCTIPLINGGDGKTATPCD